MFSSISTYRFQNLHILYILLKGFVQNVFFFCGYLNENQDTIIVYMFWQPQNMFNLLGDIMPWFQASERAFLQKNIGECSLKDSVSMMIC